jgi:hypothetical protein
MRQRGQEKKALSEGVSCRQFLRHLVWGRRPAALAPINSVAIYIQSVVLIQAQLQKP